MSQGKRRVTLQDLAARAGVGVATVDRVLNERAPVSARTAARVLEAADALDYHGKRLIRRRIEEMAPARTFGFILQKRGKWFYRTLAEAIEVAAAGLTAVRPRLEIAFVESLSPEELAKEIARMRSKADAIALVSIEHQTVTAAIAETTRQGVPVFAMLSPLTAPDLAGFVGIDGRKAGRTAGWAMARLLPGEGEVGILVGSHRYLGHEALEAGFRSAVREYAPGLRLRESLVYLDDSAVAHEAAAELLQSCPDLAGLYHCGGGVSGVLRALAQSGRAGKLVYICHEGSPAARQGLVDGVVDMVLATPVGEIARTVTAAMEAASTGRRPEPPAPLKFRILTPENP